jgi:hypothetical protein
MNFSRTLLRGVVVVVVAAVATRHGGAWGERRYSSYSLVSVTPRLHFTPGERIPGTHCTGGWVGPRVGLDVGARRKILCPCRGSNPDRPARSQTLSCLSYRGSWW